MAAEGQLQLRRVGGEGYLVLKFMLNPAKGVLW